MNKWVTVLIIAVVIAASVGGVLAVDRYYFKDETPDDDFITAKEGDEVTVHYEGWLRDERIYQEKRVFDTSRETVPGNKILTWEERDRGEPFNFTVGEGVIEGWTENIIGMREGETKTFTVPPEKAYGDKASEELIFQVDKIETLPVYEETTVDEFRYTYGQDPKPNMVVTDVFWNWKTMVTAIEGSHVTIQHTPKEGEVYTTYQQDGSGWRSKVLSIDSTANEGRGEIVVEHMVNKGTVLDANYLAHHEKRFEEVLQIKEELGQDQRPFGIVVNVNDDQITVDFNGEIYSKPLIFTVTVLDIQKAEE